MKKGGIPRFPSHFWYDNKKKSEVVKLPINYKKKKVSLKTSFLLVPHVVLRKKKNWGLGCYTTDFVTKRF